MADTAVSPTTQAAGIVNFASGSFTGAATTTTTINLGFAPRWCRFLTPTGVITWEKDAHMPAANCLKTVTAGTMTYDTSSNVLFVGNTIVVKAAVAVLSDLITWVAFG